MMRFKVSRNFILLSHFSCGEIAMNNKLANVGALILIGTLLHAVLVILNHPSFVQRFLEYKVEFRDKYRFNQ